METGAHLLAAVAADWLALNREGFNAEPALAADSRFSGGLLLLGKHRGRNEAWFAELLARVEPGGWIVVAGDKKLGVDSFRKWVGNIAEISDRLSKNHAVAFWLQRPADLDDEFIAALKPLAADIDTVFRTEPGMFSHGVIDKGSALLAAHMEKIVFGRVADLGAGSVHHVAFAVENRAKQLEVRKALMDTGYHVTPVIDRDYFWAIYFRTPGGVLFEVATNEPGFDRDEDTAHLGEALKLPTQHQHLRPYLEQHLQKLED